MKFHLILWDEAVWRVKSNNVKGFRHQRLLDMAGVQIVSKNMKKRKSNIITSPRPAIFTFIKLLSYGFKQLDFYLSIEKGLAFIDGLLLISEMRTLQMSILQWSEIVRLSRKRRRRKWRQRRRKWRQILRRGKKSRKSRNLLLSVDKTAVFQISGRLCAQQYAQKIQPRHLTLILSKLSISDWFLATSYWWYWWWFSSVKFWTVKSLTHQVDHQWGVNENVIAKEHVAVVVRFHLFAWIIEWVIIM